MHELSIAEEIKDIVLQHLKDNGKSKVTRIELIFGELTSIVPAALKLAFDSVAEGTAMHDAKIKYAVKKLKAKCRKCSKIFRIKDFNYMCPACKAGPADIIQGREMIVKSISME
jgi:hydrogenase nickel incorporation protein HypA/HybF